MIRTRTDAPHKFPIGYSVQPYEMHLKRNLFPNVFVFVALASSSFEKTNKSNSSKDNNKGLPPFWRLTEAGDEECFLLIPLFLYDAHGVTTSFFLQWYRSGAGISEPRTKAQSVLFPIATQAETVQSNGATYRSTCVQLREYLDFSFQNYLRVCEKGNK